MNDSKGTDLGGLFRCLFGLVGVFVMSVCSAQTLEFGEYFFDRDPGFGLGSRLEIDPSLETFEFHPDISELELGVHRLFVRVRDNEGAWSLTQIHPLLLVRLDTNVPPQIVRGEYFIDQDPGFGSGTVLEVDAEALHESAIVIDLADVSVGYHRLFVRYQDSAGSWGLVQHHAFLLHDRAGGEASRVMSGEYFFDIDPGVGNGLPISIEPLPVVETSFAAELGELAIGAHRLFARVQDSNRQWSFIETAEFNVDLSSGGVLEIGVTDRLEMDEDSGVNQFPLVVSGLSQDLSSLSWEWSVSDGDLLASLQVVWQEAEWRLVAETESDRFGEIKLTLRATANDGLIATRTILVVVNSVNDPPTILPIDDLQFVNDGSVFEIPLRGIGQGAANEAGDLVISVETEKNELLESIEVVYQSPEPEGVLRVRTVGETEGLSQIAVVLRDSGVTDSTTVTRFSIEIVSPVVSRPEITLTSPTNREVFCPDQPVTIRADIESLPVGIERVDFFAGDLLLESLESAPYEFQWVPPSVGDFEISACGIDPQGTVVECAVSRIAVSETCGEVLIVGKSELDEIDVIQEYLFEMGLSSLVIRPNELSPAKDLNYQLVIYHHDPQGPLSTGTIEALVGVGSRMLVDPVALPIPVYIVGNQLAGAAKELSPESRMLWMDLVGLRRGESVQQDTRIEIVDADDQFELNNGRFGPLVTFDFDQDLEIASGTDFVDVVAVSGMSDVLVSQPRFASVDSQIQRILTQNFSVFEGGNQIAVRERKRLFQNSVCWLLRCSRCTNVDLPLQLRGVPDEIALEDTISIDGRIVNNGACEATGTQVVGRLGSGLRVTDLRSDFGLRWEFDPSERTLEINFGRVGRGDPSAIEFELVIEVVGRADLELTLCTLSNNTREACRSVAFSPIGGDEPQLFIDLRDSGELVLRLEGRSEATYSIQTSRDLFQWDDLVRIEGSLEEIEIVPMEGGDGKQFYRAIIAP